MPGIIRSLFLAVLVAAALLLALPREEAASAPASRAAMLAELRDEREAVHALNLVNGLYLTREQASRLIPLVRDAAKARRNAEESAAGQAAELRGALDAVREDIVRDGRIAPPTERRYHEVSQKVESVVDGCREELQQLAVSARNVLTENQLEVVRDFVPCVIPPRSQSDPERVGQADGHSREEALLERVRQVPDERYPEARARILEKVRTLLARHLPPSEVGGHLAKVARAMDEARKMGEADFEVKRGKLAEGIALKPERPKKEDVDRRVQEFLLNPAALPLLQRIAEQGR